tara:strand:+ start:1759 stop:2466 length:708 start_codon:yes stop_codon:yes gene_type:complete
MKKIFIVGDSFCVPSSERKDFWVDVLKNRLVDYDVVLNGDPGRDIQTIIEYWIRIIKYIKEDDFLIICLPYFKRTRLPLINREYRKSGIDGNILSTRFVGTSSYHEDYQSLEIWGKDYGWNYHQEKLSHQELINVSIANQLTTLEVIESLIELTKCKVYIFSWDNMDIRSDFIEDRGVIENNIGEWETQQDVYRKRNGMDGQASDFHWSNRMNVLFGEYVINKFMTNRPLSLRSF